MMKLLGFRVMNFRSVNDSGWIDTDEITGLIGTNESGKTNLLVPLWKLKPAKDGEINPLKDFPRKKFNEIRSQEVKPVFIEALFELPDDLIEGIAAVAQVAGDQVRRAMVRRDLGGDYHVQFPDAAPVRIVPTDLLHESISSAHTELASMAAASRAEEGLLVEMITALGSALSLVSSAQEIDSDKLEEVKALLSGPDLGSAAKRSIIVPRYQQLCDILDQMFAEVTKPSPASVDEACRLVLSNLPSFVYYSNYGNLDSEIYLPHVIDNLERADLGSKEEAKARTLKVLFEFVRLSPREIHELGKDSLQGERAPTDEEIEVVSQKKKEREILLQSASAELTDKFRNWWKQGDYRFRLQADGDFFRIWVSDDKRPEEIELEGRSTGLQWFLSFYLIFLVESRDSHDGAILLLDEPGLSLHPLAQEDLSDFFGNLSATNQMLYTTHSPFMVNPDHLDRIRAVYVGEDGTTRVSANLRAGEGHSAQTHSIYPVHAALGLSVSQILLQGCQPVIVEGPSDQFYMSAIKSYLIARGLFVPKRELVFVPAGGVRGIAATAAILTGKDEALPYVVLDSDASGEDLAKKLRSNQYKSAQECIVSMADIAGIAGAEVEDLLPPQLLAKVVYRLPIFRSLDEEFADAVVAGKPIVPQIEEYAARNGVELPSGWKVDVARLVKVRLASEKDPVHEHTDIIEQWTDLFGRLAAALG